MAGAGRGATGAGAGVGVGVGAGAGVGAGFGAEAGVLDGSILLLYYCFNFIISSLILHY